MRDYMNIEKTLDTCRIIDLNIGFAKLRGKHSDGQEAIFRA